MDPYKLLSRSNKALRKASDKNERGVPPSGRVPQPQLVPANVQSASTTLGKRKRPNDNALSFAVNESQPNYFAEASDDQEDPTQDSRSSLVTSSEPQLDTTPQERLALDERKHILKQHKVKVTIINVDAPKKRSILHANKDKKAHRAKSRVFPSPLLAFKNLRSRFPVSPRLSQNLLDLGYEVPTEVQLAALPLLLDEPADYMLESTEATPKRHHRPQIDLLTVAPTGSGKTLAFLIPLIQSVLSHRQGAGHPRRQTSGIILAPTKELASQITNEGMKLAKGTGVTISLVRKSTKLSDGLEVGDFKGVDPTGAHDSEQTEAVTKSDILVSTPGTLQTVVNKSGGLLPNIRYFVLDEADVLLDPLFREQTLDIWNHLSDVDLRVSMWSATMGSSIEDLVLSTVNERRKRLSERADVEVPVAPMIRLVVGLKDSAVPNVSHRLVYAGTEKGKLTGLRQLLHPTSSSSSPHDSDPPLRPPFLIFTQTVERAIALGSELVYDVPAEAGGSSRIAVLHADLSDTAREKIMTRFRKGEVWILITTDLLSRGVDFRGVNGVVNYDIPTSSAAYVHRIGRTGRAGRDGGVAVTLYSEEDVPYLKHVANVVARSQRPGDGKIGVDQWLLSALPKLSKNQRQNLKRRGIESRTAQGQRKDPRAARKSRISTKAGFARKTENIRRGAILGAQRRSQAVSRGSDVEKVEEEFSGFD